MKLYNIIFENSIQNVDNKMQSFIEIAGNNWIELFKKRYEWLINNFKKIGNGESRIVFDIGDNKVLKLSKTNFNTQNAREIALFSCVQSEFLPKIYEFAEDYSWLISEKAELFKNYKELFNIFKIKTGISNKKWNEFKLQFKKNNNENIINDATMFLDLLMNVKFTKKLFDHLRNTSNWFEKLIILLKKCKIKINDFRLNNIGKTIDGAFVFINSSSFYFDETLEEANALASGSVSGYILPLGMKGIGSDKKQENSFWKNETGKKVKTASPALHKAKN
jgi:hypothetical protein